MELRSLVGVAGILITAMATELNDQVMPIALFSDLIDGVNDPGTAGQSGEPSGLVT